MTPIVSATVTLDDLKNYFKGSHWRTAIRDDGSLEGRSNSYFIEISPGGSPAFAVKIYAHEDEQDSNEAVTDEPMKFLVDFLKTGTSGDEALHNMASAFKNVTHLPPISLANTLRNWADEVDAHRIGPKALSRMLRRASLFPDFYEHANLLAAALSVAGREDIETKEMQELAGKMTKKGWRVKVGKNDRDLPELTVDIAGVYEAKIEIDHIPWKYTFEVHNHPETKMTGITDDPIVEFRNYYHSDSVQTAKAELKANQKEKAEQDKSRGTVAPKKRPMLRDNYDNFESGSPDRL